MALHQFDFFVGQSVEVIDQLVDLLVGGGPRMMARFPESQRDSILQPRVARAAQPWAGGRNPFGIQLWKSRKASGLARLPKLTAKNAENTKRENGLVNIPGGRFLTQPFWCKCLLFVFFAIFVVIPFRKSG